jgi:hypothetical protein
MKIKFYNNWLPNSKLKGFSFETFETSYEQVYFIFGFCNFYMFVILG